MDAGWFVSTADRLHHTSRVRSKFYNHIIMIIMTDTRMFLIQPASLVYTYKILRYAKDFVFCALQVHVTYWVTTAFGRRKI